MEKNENGYSEYFFGNRSIERRSSNGSGCAGRDTRRNDGIGNGAGMGTETDDGTSCPMNTRQLAMVYSPYQHWRMLYSPDEALDHGTMFMELYKPLEECGNGRS